MIEPSTWQKIMDRSGVTSTEQGELKYEPFWEMTRNAHSWKQQGFEPARVSVSVNNGTDYGAVKVLITLNIACPQTEQYMQLAAEAGFLKALEMVNEASESLGIPTLPVVY